jgi:hypothetical protein
MEAQRFDFFRLLILRAQVDNGLDAKLFQIFITMPARLPATVEAFRDLIEPRDRLRIQRLVRGLGQHSPGERDQQKQKDGGLDGLHQQFTRATVSKRSL